MTEKWLFKNKNSETFHQVSDRPLDKMFNNTMDSLHVIEYSAYEKLEKALLRVPDVLCGKDVSMRAYKLLRDHMEGALGRELEGFNFLGKRIRKDSDKTKGL